MIKNTPPSDTNITWVNTVKKSVEISRNLGKMDGYNLAINVVNKFLKIHKNENIKDVDSSKLLDYLQEHSISI